MTSYAMTGQIQTPTRERLRLNSIPRIDSEQPPWLGVFAFAMDPDWGKKLALPLNYVRERLVSHPLLIRGYNRFNFVRASSILNCQSTARCLALVFSAQIPISV